MWLSLAEIQSTSQHISRLWPCCQLLLLQCLEALLYKYLGHVRSYFVGSRHFALRNTVVMISILYKYSNVSPQSCPAPLPVWSWWTCGASTLLWNGPSLRIMATQRSPDTPSRRPTRRQRYGRRSPTNASGESCHQTDWICRHKSDKENWRETCRRYFWHTFD